MKQGELSEGPTEYIISCELCNSHDVEYKYSPRWAREHFEKLGWQKIKGKWYCVRHTRKDALLGEK